MQEGQTKAPMIALGHLFLAKLVAVLFLLQHKQQVFLPVTLQTRERAQVCGW